MTIDMMTEEGRGEHLVSLLVQDPQVNLLLSEALEAWEKLQEMASLLQSPSIYIDQEVPWTQWDLCLRRHVRALGPALFEAAVQLRSPSPQAAPIAAPQEMEPIAPILPQPVEISAKDAARDFEAVAQEEEVADEAEVEWISPLDEEHSVELPSLFEPTTVVETPSVPITQDIVAQLQKSFSSRDLRASMEAQKEVAQGACSEVLQRARNMNMTADGHQDDRLMMVLEHNASQSVVKMTQDVPHAAQVYFFHMLVAHARYLQDRRPNPRFRVMFGKLREYLKKVEFIHGMAMSHKPQRKSWKHDAEHYWAELRRELEVGPSNQAAPGRAGMDPGTAQREVEALLERAEDSKEICAGLHALLEQGMKPDTRICRLLAEHLDSLSGRVFKPLRKAIRKQLQADDEEEEVNHRTHSAAPSADWPFWMLTRGKKAMVIGSLGKKYQLESIQQVFGFSQVDWIGGKEGIRRIQAMNSSNYKNDYIYLVMHRYVSHCAADPIWAKRDDAVVIGVSHGFSVGAVRLGFEKDGQCWLDRQLLTKP